MAINCLTERGNRTTALRSDSRRSRQRTGMADLGRFRPLSGRNFDAAEGLILANLRPPEAPLRMSAFIGNSRLGGKPL